MNLLEKLYYAGVNAVIGVHAAFMLGLEFSREKAIFGPP
jgi:hypothetical protein